MLPILVFNVLVVSGSPTALNLPEKLRQYQAGTGISGTQLLNIYKNSLAKRNSTSLGDQDNLFRTTNTFPGGDYFPTSEFPKFRLTLIGKSRKQNLKIGKSPTVFYGNKIQKNFKNPDLGTSPAVIYGNKIQAKILSTWS